ncbi:MAG: ATP-binding protein [bacterium]|nr:ATP-binding protein [bacterium]MDZ4343106.1 ATP-binding protein [Candidatus Binatia bacterium]
MYINRIIQSQVELALKNKKVLFLLGARQVGKTTLIEHIISDSQGILLNMDIDIDRARVKAAAKLSPPDAMRSLGAAHLLIIDEAQRESDIGRICKGWYDAKVEPKIILLGSSSHTLLETAAADLTGRNEKLWLTPLLFSEILADQKWYSDSLEPASMHQDFGDQINALLLNRLIFGSYPESYLAEDPRQYLTNLISDYLLKDIFTASLVRSPEDVRRLLVELAQAIGQTISINQLAARLKLSRQTVNRYLDLLAGIYVIFSVPAYSTNGDKEINKGRKYYFWDNGVKNALQREWVVSTNRSDIKALWQNWVMAEIFKQSRTYNRQEDLYFWQSRAGSTVDLVVKQGNTLHAFDTHFEELDAKPSRAFYNLYRTAPQTIHQNNFLEFLT